MEVDGKKRPLLGRGKLDVLRFLQGKDISAASVASEYEPLSERVHQGCGMIGLSGDQAATESSGILQLLLFSPILLVAYFRRKIHGRKNRCMARPCAQEDAAQPPVVI